MFLYNKLNEIKGRNKIRPQYPVFVAKFRKK